VQEEKLQTFTYWVDQTLFRPLDKDNCKKLLKFEERFVILFVGRLTEEKGVRVLLSVAKKLGDTLDNAIFAFVGIGPLAQEVIDASKHVRNVRFQGVVSNKDTPLWYNASDVLVVPSIHEEGFGRIILESLACGTPVIAFNVGGVPEALDTSVGILAQPTAESLTNAITYLYNNPDALMKLTEKCRPYAQKRFSEDNARLIEQAYFAYSK
jgi:glycosyltransferase involved in cell wall biosynthesis